MGGSYNFSGAISTYTGIPTLLNWPGYQLQWRGSTYGSSVGSREPSVDQLYSDPTWNTAQRIISEYGIDYIVFGAKNAASTLRPAKRSSEITLRLCANTTARAFTTCRTAGVGDGAVGQ